ncbi:MAG: hypothetical protein AUG89_11525 [Acidobacteria bacterium 13_1_20CM_4_56_7]|nr:MAG: hypothetical protein AUG89_11525 [Acidobacteria bacterium 13_1_20CM_4_56_7]
MTEFKESMRYEYPIGVDSLVIDAGGFRGDWFIGMRDRYGCRVLCFDPITSFCTVIRERAQGRFPVFQCGIGGKSRWEDFHIQNDSTGLHATGERVETVWIEDIHCLLTNVNSTRSVSVLKLNIEGMEFEVIERLIDTGLIECIQNLQVQFHDCAINAKARFDHIQAALADTHYLTFDAGWIWQNWRMDK